MRGNFGCGHGGGGCGWVAERDVVNLQGSCHVFHVAQSFDVCLSGLTTCDIITIVEFAASDKQRCSGIARFSMR